MAGEDVKVTIGADLSPIQKTFAQVKVQAQQTASSVGIVFDRGAQRAESRVQRGMDGVIRSILKAKNPIEAVSGALEGLGRAFAIASTAFLAIGVISALVEAFMTAKDSADKLAESVEKLGQVDANNESVHQLQKDIDDFQKYEQQYNDRGLLEKILFGPKEDEDFAKAANLNGLKKNLLDIKKIEEENIKLQARLLEASDNPEDKKKAKILRKSIADTDEKGELQAEVDDAQKEGDDLVDALQAQQRKIDDFELHKKQRVSLGVATPEDIDREKKALDDEYDGIVKEMEANDDKVAKLKANQALLAKDQAAEAAQADKEDKKESGAGRNESAEREAAKVKEETERQAKLKADAAEVGMTGEEKAAALKKKIADEQKADAAEVGPKRQSQILAEQNQLLEDQLALKKQIAENDREIAEKTAEAKRKQDLTTAKRAEDVSKRDQLADEIAEARKKAVQDEVNASVFHGPVTSLRREGFGKTPGGGSVHGALKSALASEKHLADLLKQMTRLNAKIGGVA